MKSKRPIVISLGEVLWDLYEEGSQFGGAPANFACHAAALGGDVTLVSAVGNDTRGRDALEILEGYGIHVDLIQSHSTAPTGTVGIELDENRKPTFSVHEGSAWDRLHWPPELDSRIQKADAIYFGTLGQRSEPSRSTIRRGLAAATDAGVPRLLDVNLRAPFYDDVLIRESLQGASILKLSEDELATVCAAGGVSSAGPPENALRQLQDAFQLAFVVMTRGAEGALLVSANEIVDQPGIATVVRDTVGAGDSFTAALAMGMLHGDSYAAILQSSCETAAATCSQQGAVPI